MAGGIGTTGGTKTWAISGFGKMIGAGMEPRPA